MMQPIPMLPFRKTEFYNEHPVPWQMPIRIPSAAGILLLCGISAAMMLCAGLALMSGQAFVFFLLWMSNWVITGYLGLRFGAIRGGIAGVILYGFFCSLLGFGALFGFMIASLSHGFSFGAIAGIMVGAFMGPLIYGMATRSWALSLLDRAYLVPMMHGPPPADHMRPMAPSAVRTPYPMTPEAQQFWTAQQPGRGMPPPPSRPRR
jgi:hypothetical protein